MAKNLALFMLLLIPEGVISVLWKMDIFRSSKKVGAILSLAFCILTVNAHGKLNDVEALQQKALKDNIDRFGKFTQSKDVMGKGKLPNGQLNQGGEKNRMDKDDGVSYTSIFTYHRNAFDDYEEAQGGAPGTPPKKERLNQWVSPHGKFTGDSSILERLVYKFHQMFKEKPKTDAEVAQMEKQGKREESVFIVESQDPEDGGGGGGGNTAGGGGSGSQVKKVERYILKEEVQEGVKKDVGQVGFENTEKEAKDEENKNDPKAMGLIPFFYEAAQRAYDAWRDTTLAGLGQRRMYNVSKVRGSESAPSCDEAVQASIQKELQSAQSDAERTKIRNDANGKIERCKQVTKLDYREIAPIEEADPNGGPPKLKSEGLAKEDGMQRDLRVQAEVLDRYGAPGNSIKSGWKYSEDEFKTKIAVEFDENGEVSREENWTGAEQLESFNEQLVKAEDGWGAVKSKLQGTPYDTGDVNATQFKEEPGKKYAGDISKIRSENRKEEFGDPTPKSEENQLATTYDDILKKQAEGGI
jgi:hypothetical protein